MSHEDFEKMQRLLDETYAEYEKNPEKVKQSFMMEAFTFCIERSLFLGLITNPDMEQSKYIALFIRKLGESLDSIIESIVIHKDIKSSLDYFNFVTSKFNGMDKAFFNAMPEPKTVFTVKSFIDFLDNHEKQDAEKGIVSIVIGENVFTTLVKNNELRERFEILSPNAAYAEKYLLAGMIGQFLFRKVKDDKAYRVDVFSDLNRDADYKVLNPNYIYVMQNCSLEKFRVKHSSTFDSLQFETELRGAEVFEFSEQNFLQ